MAMLIAQFKSVHDIKTPSHTTLRNSFVFKFYAQDLGVAAKAHSSKMF